MKKVLVSLICVGLLTGSMASAVTMTPKRLAQCVFAPEKNGCTKEERKTALGWFIGVPAAIVLATLALLGIKVSSDQVKKIQDQKRQQIAAAQSMQIQASTPGFQENPAFKSEAQQLMDKASQVDLSKEVGMF